jgi:hypothetical protein
MQTPVAPLRAKRRPENARQAWLVGLCALAAFGAALFAANAGHLFRPAPHPLPRSAAELYTGSIQLAPSRESRCRRMAFDNRSGQMHDRGTVLCGAAALTESGTAPGQAPSKLDRIREGFRNR